MGKQKQDPPSSSVSSPTPDFSSKSTKLDFDGLEDAGFASEKHNKPKGVYAIYKEATQAFHDEFAKLLPKKFRLSRIEDYKRGADFILEQSTHCYQGLDSFHGWGKLSMVQINESIFRHLNTSIRHRQEQMRKHGDNDRGHLYILSVLGYCREALLYCRQMNQAIQKQDGQRRIAQSFSDSTVWHFERETKENDAEAGQPVMELPPPPMSPSSLDSEGDDQEDIIHADDRFQCIAFLDTMDRLMGVLRNRFDEIKRLCMEEDCPTLLHELMKASIAANLCMECVQTTWAELTLEHPHIRSFYDVIALVFVLPEIKKNSTRGPDDDILHHINPRHPHLILHFVGDVIQACFSAEEGMYFTKALNELGSKLGLPDGGWEKEELLEQADALAREISDMVLEPRSSNKVRTSFLYGYKFIGERRCILNTQKVLQSAFGFLQQQKKGGKGSWTKMAEHLASAGQHSFNFHWHEDKNPARDVQSLDRLMISEILPELLLVCGDENRAFLSGGVPRRLLPVLDSMSQRIKNQKLADPIPVHMTFAFHSILISILSLQGNGHMQKLASTAKLGVESMFRILKDRSPSPRHCMALDIVEDPTRESEVSFLSPSSSRHALWNPILAGCYCLFSAYVGNILVATMFLPECHLRSVLHFYNALRQYKLVPKLEILNLMDGILAEAPSIWFTGKKPTSRGDFTRTYVLGTGVSTRTVSAIIGLTKMELGLAASGKRYANDREELFSFRPSLAVGLSSSQVSRGWKAIFRRDYPENNAHLVHKTVYSWENGTYNEVTECEAVIFQTCDAVQRDIDLHGGGLMDITKVAKLCRDFFMSISEQLGFEDVTDFTNTTSLLGEMDFLPESKQPRVKQLAQAMTDFFSPIERSAYTFPKGN